jgi:putative transposase
VTVWEWRNAKRRLFDQGKRDLDEDAIFSALALQRRIEDDAAASTATARRKAAKRPRATKEQSKVAPLTGIDTSKQYPGEDDLEFWE